VSDEGSSVVVCKQNIDCGSVFLRNDLAVKNSHLICRVDKEIT
jgi:hypothetical protein